MTKETFTRKVFQGDIPIWIIFMLLCSLSLVEVFSATSTLAYNEANIWTPIARHAMHLTIGFFCVLGLTRMPTRLFPIGGSFLMVVAIILLAAVPFVGISVNDASRWIRLFGIQFQPSEVAKLAASSTWPSCSVKSAFASRKRRPFIGSSAAWASSAP